MLTNQQVIEILEDWSFWGKQPADTGLLREIELPPKLSQDIVLVIQGVRRCGKSTLLMQLPKRYGLNFALCYYCNFEDPRLLGGLDHSLLSQIIALAREKIDKGKPCYFFFDEIQNVQGWEKWLHVQLERPKNNYFVVTGSNSSLLNGEFATALTGRHISVELFPFSLSEYQKVLPNKKLNDYLAMGGFPRVLSFPQPYKLLQEYFNDIILRDVLKRVQARSPEAIKQVVKMAFDCCGTELSYRKIAATTGLTVDTVKVYLDACEQAYLLFACPFFSFSEKVRAQKQKKYYPVDPGLRFAITGTTNRDLGKCLELLVFLHLKQKYSQVYYWQEIHKGEVDFVIQDDATIVPYQVTWQTTDHKTAAKQLLAAQQESTRYERALQNFYMAFPHASEAIIITKENARDFLL